MALTITITSKKHGTFDVLYSKEDQDLINSHTWGIAKLGNRFYPKTDIKNADGKYRTKFLHGLIMGTPKGMHTDHISGNTCDARRENLRVCTPTENQRNRGKNKNNTSGFKGVSWNKASKKWVPYIQYGGKKIHLGTFDTREEAARTYDRKVIELWEVVNPRMLNFPEEHGF